MPVTSEVTSDYSGSLTPTSSGEETEEESEEEEDASSKKVTESSSLLWAGTGTKRVAFIMFRPESLISRDKRLKAIGEKYHLAYKMVKTESKLVRSVLSTYGFHEVHPNSPDFNLMWTGAHLKPFSLRSLQDFQKVNHFPRSYEITRKDRLFKNIDRMAHTKGMKHFDFMPRSYLMPSEYQDFCAAYVKDKGPWIVKPIASSRGRGIYLINNPNQVPLEDNIMVCKYIGNPLLIDGFKFDIRVYIAVTSYDPLMIYLFEEGLTRFATVKYEKTNRHLKNQMMHLTNYSINKKSHDYVRCEDPEVEDYGNKWSMSAMLRYLKQEGIDTTSLMMRIEAVIIKSIIAAELPIATACKMFVPNRENCMELYGFDILVDENLKPWLLEGNLSPSLACDAPLDLKIKSCMVSDFFSLVGFQCVDPLTRRQKKDQMRRPYSAKGLSGVTSMQGTPSKRPISASGAKDSSMSGLSNEEAKVLQIAKEQYQRRGSFIRIFPTPESWELYGSFLEYKSNLNLMLAQKLFPDRVKSKVSGAYSSAVARMRSIAAGQMLEGRNRVITERFMQYERKLLSLESLKHKRTKKTYSKKKKKETPMGIDNKSLPQGHLRKVSRSGEVSDVSEEDEAGEDDTSEADSDKPPFKSTPKLQFSSSSTSTSRVSSSSAKSKKPTAQKSATAAGGAGGDLNPLTKSAYASARAKDSAKSSVSTTNSITSSSKTNVTVKPGSKSAPRERPTEMKVPTQRVYTYKSSDKKDAAGDSKSHATSAKLKNDVTKSTLDADDDSDSSSESDNDEQSTQKLSTHNRPSTGSTTKQSSAITNSPRTKYQKRTVDVLQALKAGGNLGKVQARQAFSAYLSRVQQRLMLESEGQNHETSETVGKQEEQMDLVLRFLKRAAGNLRQSFSVVVPSRRLCLPDRKRILAKQLGDFVHIYNKETDAMEHKQTLGFDKETTDAWTESVQENTHIKDSDFRMFVMSASETELEEVLTTYTHKNKSASVFLGASKPKPRDKRDTTPNSLSTAPPNRLQQRSRLTSVDHLPSQPLVQTGSLYQAEEQREMKEMNKSLYELNLHRRTGTPFTSLRMRSPSPTSSVTSMSSRTAAPASHMNPHPSSAFLHPTQNVSSLQQAAYIYSSKLTPPTSVSNVVTTQPAPQKRPSSARDFNAAPVASNQPTGRPISAATGRGGLGGSLHYQTAANEEAIADALQKLAERQAARQYSATSQLQALTQHLSNLNLANMSAARQHPMSQQQHGPVPQRASSLSDLASSDIDPAMWDVQSNQSVLTGNSKYTSPGFQYGSGLQSNGPGQQVLAQQSKELLQQSKAKHQAMVAQGIDCWGEDMQTDLVNARQSVENVLPESTVPTSWSLLDSLVGTEEGSEEQREGNGDSKNKQENSYRLDAAGAEKEDISLFFSKIMRTYVPIKYESIKQNPGSGKGDSSENQGSGSSSKNGKKDLPKSERTRKESRRERRLSGKDKQLAQNKEIPKFGKEHKKRPKSRVEHVWNSYHSSTTSSPNNKSSSKIENDSHPVKNKRPATPKGSRSRGEVSQKQSNENVEEKSETESKAGSVSSNVAKSESNNGNTIKNILSEIKDMFESGELPCKRWRYQTSGTGYVRPRSVASSGQDKTKESLSKSGRVSQAHNVVSNSVASTTPTFLSPGGEQLSLKQRPSSASMVHNGPTLGPPTSVSNSMNQSNNSSSRPPQVPRPPEGPKPIERPPSIRKPLGNAKIPRTGSHPQLTGLSPNPSTLGKVDDSYQLNFYNSLKYDASTGSTKVVDMQDSGSSSIPNGNVVEAGSRPSSAKRPTWKP